MAVLGREGYLCSIVCAWLIKPLDRGHCNAIRERVELDDSKLKNSKSGGVRRLLSLTCGDAQQARPSANF